MKAATKNVKLSRWFHILSSIPILSYIYGPVASMPEPAFAVKFVILQAVVLGACFGLVTTLKSGIAPDSSGRDSSAPQKGLILSENSVPYEQENPKWTVR